MQLNYNIGKIWVLISLKTNLKAFILFGTNWQREQLISLTRLVVCFLLCVLSGSSDVLNHVLGKSKKQCLAGRSRTDSHPHACVKGGLSCMCRFEVWLGLLDPAAASVVWSKPFWEGISSLSTIFLVLKSCLKHPRLAILRAYLPTLRDWRRLFKRTQEKTQTANEKAGVLVSEMCSVSPVTEMILFLSVLLSSA